MKIYKFWCGQLFIYFELIVYLVQNLVCIADMASLIHYKVVQDERLKINIMSKVVLVYIR